jgi:hypothetical protein
VSKFSIKGRTAPSLLACLIPAVLIFPGCGDGKFPVVPTKGKVVCNGKPVTSGSVTFSPMGSSDSLETGKPASGALSAEGTFVLTTNDRFDGAIVGKHSVRYFASEGEDQEETSSSEGSADERAKNAETIKQRKLAAQNSCVQKDEIVVEVKADGENDFTIELTPAAGGRAD